MHCESILKHLSEWKNKFLKSQANSQTQNKRTALLESEWNNLLQCSFIFSKLWQRISYWRDEEEKPLIAYGWHKFLEVKTQTVYPHCIEEEYCY